MREHESQNELEINDMSILCHIMSRIRSNFREDVCMRRIRWKMLTVYEGDNVCVWNLMAWKRFYDIIIIAEGVYENKGGLNSRIIR